MRATAAVMSVLPTPVSVPVKKRPCIVFFSSPRRQQGRRNAFLLALRAGKMLLLLQTTKVIDGRFLKIRGDFLDAIVKHAAKAVQ